MVNMPGRTDKLNAMKLSASLTGFQFDIIKSVSGADVPATALPGVSITTSACEVGLTIG